MISPTLKELIVDRISRICGVCTIYLFGSYAYGTPAESSDIDIAVVMDKVESAIAKAAEIWDALNDVPIPKDIVVVSRDDFDFYKNEAGSLYRTIYQKGLVLNVP